MARIAEIEDRLMRWAEYFKSGDACGYPVKSTLHEDWAPPSPGMTRSMRVAPANDAPQTHRMVSKLSQRLQATLVAVYVMRMTAGQAAVALACEPATVHARIDTAHRGLAGMLGVRVMQV